MSDPFGNHIVGFSTRWLISQDQNELELVLINKKSDSLFVRMLKVCE